MNERIRELRGQVKLDTNSLLEQREINDMVDFLLKDPGNKILNAYMDKFAELIIKECARVPINMWDKAELNADIAVKIEDRIRTEFGIPGVKR
jgi:hypothetical protein